PRAGTVIGTRAICGAPRGLAYDAALDAVHVACATGDLVTVPAAGGNELRRIRVDVDLRDVVVQQGELIVSRFRSAERLMIDPNGSIVGRSKPPLFYMAGRFEPGVAWRMQALPNGGTLMVHQRALLDPVPAPLPPVQSYYGNAMGANAAVPDPAIAHSTVTVMRASSPTDDRVAVTPSPLVPLAGLPVDVAVSPLEDRVAIASATSGGVFEMPMSYFDTDQYTVGAGHTIIATPGQPVAVTYDAGSRLIVQTRRPAALFFVDDNTSVALGEEPRRYGAADVAHDLFHLPAGAASGAMACATCHPEGGDDGHKWVFTEFGERRTASLRGGIEQTHPLHWRGELANMGAVVDEVFMLRMGGADPGEGHVEALASWVDALPSLPAPSAMSEAAERGRILFEDTTVGCSSCHAGAMLTDNKTVDVNTGGPFQVPSLVGVAHRAPFMHNGCAATLHDRFGPCGGGDAHGRTSQLTPEQINDLVAYLETL
ncbi:MAG TPA: c-type cytochrome, partial [Polyangiaceae bacterium]|nr:c-type cytochrome [Polyangiaceae bacterium]